MAAIVGCLSVLVLTAYLLASALLDMGPQPCLHSEQKCVLCLQMQALGANHDWAGVLGLLFCCSC
jgi:hypothetical protein